MENMIKAKFMKRDCYTFEIRTTALRHIEKKHKQTANLSESMQVQIVVDKTPFCTFLSLLDPENQSIN